MFNIYVTYSTKRIYVDRNFTELKYLQNESENSDKKSRCLFTRNET